MPEVYAARYSNVPVWVSKANDVQVMRRQGDGWVNATHLLKVANFDKPRRTRILERDVQTGEHEKVQGGYGKYQGTWIPVERAYALSEQVGILPFVEALLAFSPKDGEAAALPKQAKAPAARKTLSGTTLSGQKVKRPKKMPSVGHVPVMYNMGPMGPNSPVPMGQMAQQMGPMGGQVGGQVGGPGQLPGQLPGQMGGQRAPLRAQAMQSMPQLTTNFQGWQFSPQSPYTPVVGQQMMPPYPVQSPYYVSPSVPANRALPPQAASQAAQTAKVHGRSGSASSSPSVSSSVLSSNDDAFSDDDKGGDAHSQQTAQQRAANRAQTENAQAAARANTWTGASSYMAEYSSKLLNFFMSPDKTQIPPSLLEPEPGTDLDHPIDDEGNTAFHWTCAIGRLELVRALISAGVNTAALNKNGQTALSFLVMFTNNYEMRTFPKLLELLQNQIAFVDPKGRTVLHHIANSATSSSRSAMARYYMELLLAKVSSDGAPSISADGQQNKIGADAPGAKPGQAETANASGAPSAASASNGGANAMTFAQWLDHQDHRGDTALHVASRRDSRKLVKVLLSYRASPVIPNKQGQTADDLYTRARRKRDESLPRVPHNDALSDTARLAQQTSAEIATRLHDLAESFDRDIANKESDIEQVQTLVDKIRQDILDAEMAVPALQSEVGDADKVETQLAQLHQTANDKLRQLRQLIERSQARDLAGLVQGEESRAPVGPELNEEFQVDRERQAKLGAELAELQKNRKMLVAEIGTLYSEAGSSEKIAKYRKLLAVCCEVPEELVDGLLDGINNALDSNGA